MTTPERVAEAVGDFAIAGSVIRGQARDEFLFSFSKRIAQRVQDDDERLRAFDKRVDRDGYLWLPEGVWDWRETAVMDGWSFERCFTALSDAVAAAPDPLPGELEEATRQWEEHKRRLDVGFRLVHVEMSPDGETAQIFVRKDG